MLFMRTATRSREQNRFRICLERVSAVIFPNFFPNVSFFPVGYCRTIFLQQVPSKVSLCPSPTLQKYSHHRTCQRSYSRVPTFSVRQDAATMMGSRCPMVDFNNSTSYKSFSTVLNLFNNGSLIASWVFLSFRYFVIVCLDLSMI